MQDVGIIDINYGLGANHLSQGAGMLYYYTPMRSYSCDLLFDMAM